MITTYHVLKTIEGGIGQYAAQIAKDKGATKVVKTTSCYIGHTAIVVTATKRVHDRISMAIYGR